jgi:hypothetical protein
MAVCERMAKENIYISISSCKVGTQQLTLFQLVEKLTASYGI